MYKMYSLKTLIFICIHYKYLSHVFQLILIVIMGTLNFQNRMRQKFIKKIIN